MNNQDEVRLAVPATPEFLRLARVTASGLASRLGFTFDEVEDLRLAIDELCFMLIGSKGRDGMVHLHYSTVSGGLEVVGVGSFTDDGIRHPLSPFSEQILSALVNEYSVDDDPEGRPGFRLRKQRQSESTSATR